MSEGSLSFKRALVVVQTSPRLKNNEGSTFGLLRTNDSVESKEKVRSTKGERQHCRRAGRVLHKDCTPTIWLFAEYCMSLRQASIHLTILRCQLFLV